MHLRNYYLNRIHSHNKLILLLHSSPLIYVARNSNRITVSALSLRVYKGAFDRSVCSSECRSVLRDPYTANILYFSQLEKIEGKFIKERAM